jgi:hypothetical protein
MWFQKRGLVTSIKENHCIVVTPDGSYERIALPSQGVTVGEEVLYNRVRIPAQLKPVLMAASFLLVFMSSIILYQAKLNQVAAYVALDINPSLEISVNRNLTVIDVLCLNEEAAKLVTPGEFKGKSLNHTISEIINEAVEKEYIKLGEENLIVSTISSVDADAEMVNQKVIRDLVAESVASKGCKVQVKVYATSDDIRQEASNAGISSGKYLIYKELKKNGKPVKIDEVKKDSVRKLVEKHQVELPPNFKNFTSDHDKRGIKSNGGKKDDRKEVPGKAKGMINNGSKAPENTKDEKDKGRKDTPQSDKGEKDKDEKDKDKDDKGKDKTPQSDKDEKDKSNKDKTKWDKGEHSNLFSPFWRNEWTDKSNNKLKNIIPLSRIHPNGQRYSPESQGIH